MTRPAISGCICIVGVLGLCCSVLAPQNSSMQMGGGEGEMPVCSLVGCFVFRCLLFDGICELGICLSVGVGVVVVQLKKGRGEQPDREHHEKQLHIHLAYDQPRDHPDKCPCYMRALWLYFQSHYRLHNGSLNVCFMGLCMHLTVALV